MERKKENQPVTEAVGIARGVTTDDSHNQLRRNNETN